MAKQLNVKLNFQADTSQAEQALRGLSYHLNTIANLTPAQGATKLTNDLLLAKQSAQDLQMHLLKAFNTKTGNLNLNKLEASLKSSNQSLGQLGANLLKAGKSGQQAFLNIQRAISNANVQISQANGLLIQFWTTLKNTARWQLSSSILHGFMGSLQSAWGYAKNLDESLNNIRIVTNQSQADMAKFAIEANKAAKALNTTTTAYTNASLIYYQQGLSAEEVKERTDITIKMANVSRESSEVVSDQLTAVWNNFYDGSKSLEYYADVMTALGAATASSTAEISEGLNKFAAVAETVGLSYEYAAAALATVTATTRQSADVVGTAFKTLFARIQDLELGKTLDDGTTLGSYSQALEKVGIQIKTSSGEMKEMDAILNEMAKKWQTLSKDQQVALAQNVAGVRQYTQLIALMDNWDFMQENLNVAETSSGALQSQADIYADSWEAAMHRVKASAEDIYRDLFPTEKLTGLVDGFTFLLHAVDGVVESLGGLKGILLLISSIVLNNFSTGIGTVLNSMIGKITSLTMAGKSFSSAWNMTGTVSSVLTLSSHLKTIRDNTGDAAKQANIFNEYLKNGSTLAARQNQELGQAAFGLNSVFSDYSSNLLEVNNLQTLITQSSKYLTAEQKEQLSLLQQQALSANDQLLIAQTTYDQDIKRLEMLKSQTGDDLYDDTRFIYDEQGQNLFKSSLFGSHKKEVEDVIRLWNEIAGITNQIGHNTTLIGQKVVLNIQNTENLNEVNKKANETYTDIYTANQKINSIIEQAAKEHRTINELSEQEQADIRKINAELKSQEGLTGTITKRYVKNEKSVEDIVNGLKQAEQASESFARSTGSSEKNIQQLKGGVDAVGTSFSRAQMFAEQVKTAMSQVTTVLNQGFNAAFSVGQVAAGMAGQFSSMAMGISSVSNAMKTLSDENADWVTKLTAGSMAAMMGMRGLMAVMTGVKTGIDSIRTATALKMAVEQAQLLLTKEQNSEEAEEIITNLESIAVTKLKMTEEQKETFIKAIQTQVTEKGSAATMKDTVVNYANAASQAAKYWWIALIVASVAALTYAIWKVVQAEDEEARALKQANAQLEQAKTAYDEARDAAANFKDELSSYEDALNNIKELTGDIKGMSDAIDEANKKAKQLLQSFQMYDKKYFSYDANGAIVISDDAKTEMQNIINQRALRAEMAYYASLIGQKQAQLNYDASKFSDGSPYSVHRTYIDHGNYDYEYTGYVTDEDAMGRTDVITNYKWLTTEEVKKISKILNDAEQEFENVGEAIEYIKANANGLDGSILFNLDEIITDETLDKFINFGEGLDEAAEASRYYAEQLLGISTNDMYKDVIEKASGGDKAVANLMYAAKNAILLSKEEDLLTKQTNLSSELATNVINKEENKDNANTTEKNLNEFITGLSIFGEDQDYQSWLMDNYTEIFGKNATKPTDANLNTAEMGKSYLESQGYTVTGFKDKDGKIVYEVMDAEGKIDTKEYSNSQIMDSWAQFVGNYAIQQSVQQASNQAFSTGDADQLFTAIMNNGNQYGADFSKSLLAGIANNGVFDFSSIYGDISETEFNKLKDMSAEDLAKLFFGEEYNKLLPEGFTADDFKKAFNSGMENWSAETASAGIDEKYEKSAEEDYDLDKGVFKAYRKSAEAGEGFENDTGKDYANTWLNNLKETDIVEYTEALNKLAIVNTRFSRGQEKLTSNWEEWNNIMSDSEASIHDINKIMPDLNESLADILNWDVKDVELLPHDFAQKYWDVIQDVYNGVEGAQERLAGLATHEYVISLGVDTNNLDDKAQKAYNSIMNQLQEMPDLEVGMTLNDAGMYNALQTLLDSGAITVDQMNAILSKIGFDPKITYEPMTYQAAQRAGHKAYIKTDNGEYSEITSTQTIDSEATVWVPKINSEGTVYQGPPPTTLNQTRKNSGGGGGQKKQKKSSSDEKDRYHVVREQLEDLNKAQERIAKSKDQAFGKSKLDLMQAEVEVLDDLIAKQDEYLTEIDDYLRKDRAKMIVYGAEFDENGVISNYDALLQKELDIYNAAVEKFNKDGNEEAFEAAEERYENFKKDLEQYEETMDLWEDEQAERAEMMREKWDQQFEALTYEIEFKLDIEEDSLKLLDYFLSKIEDDAFAAAEAISLLGQQTQDAMDKIELNRQGIEGLLGMHNLDMSILDQIQKGEVSLEDLGEYGFSDEEISQLRTYVEGLTDGNTELLELRETIQDKVLEALDAWNEKIDTNIDKMDNLTSIMESYQSIIELVGKSTLKLNDDFLNNLAQEGVNNSVNKLATSVAKYNGLLEEQARAQEALDKARESGSEQDIKLWEKTLQEVGVMVDEAQQGMMDSWNEALESAANAFEQAVANAVDTFEKSMAGAFGNLDGLQEVFDQQAEIAERYLADYAKIYELNKLNRDITNSIDDNDSIKAKRVLRDLQKEINDLQESETELSQYDVDHLRKKYELRLAEIALEEAQNAKSQVRMRRDTEGNWSYVYTADENKIEEARQNYEDKLYEMQELNNEYIHEMQSNILKSEVELANALRELDKVKFASDEEYYAEVARLQGYYLGQHNYYTDELNKALGNNQETYNVDWTNYSNLTGYKISKNEEYTDKFNETILSQLTGYQTLEEVQDAFTNHSQAMVEDLKVAYDNWKTNYDTIFNTAGTSIDNFANTTASAYEKIATDSQKATEDAQQTAKDMTTAFDDICTAVTTWQETWSTALSEAIKENEKFITSTYNLIKALSELKGTIPETDKPSESTQEDINNAKDELNNSNKALSPEDKWGKKGWNNQEYATEDVIKAQKLVRVSADGRWGPISEQAAIEAGYLGGLAEVVEKAIQKFDTGGYTGTWNNTNGRLAMLHQKELVLNEMDTANMLKAVEIVRSIARVIDLNAGSQANGLGYLNATSANNHNQVIEQEVTIHAEFPNATDHNEIEMAFDTLINRASQFANRKNI